VYGEKDCRDQIAACNKRFERGAESFARIEAEIKHLQERDTMINGTARENRAELSGRVKDLEKKVETIEQSANRILAGIAVACILMVINIVVGL
jgi:hypothetical protein